jgi:hypothetical protein
VDEREASQKDEELRAFALVYWFLFSDKSRAAELAKWNAMSYPQKNHVVRKRTSLAMFLLLCIAVYLEYLFDIHSVWVKLLAGSIATCLPLYLRVRWQEKQRRLRAGW